MVGNIAAIREQVAQVVIVDNASSAASRARLDRLAGAKVERLCNEENRGIAAALNQGIAWARSRGFAWVATFDQDSRVPPGFIAGLWQAYERFPRRENVAIVAPLYRDRGLGHVYSASEPLTPETMHDTTVSVTATSGNLVAANAALAVGGFREDFFIDCVDFEFCLRCRRAGWLVLEARGVQLDHAQGAWRRRRWLWREARINDYGAGRRYYQARNRLIMYFRYATFDPGWIARDARHFCFDFAKLILLCEERGPKLRAIGAGIRDALAGKRGSWRAATAHRTDLGKPRVPAP